LELADLPPNVRALSDEFVAELDATLGPRFVGMFQYGAVCFPPSPISDFDAHVIVDGPFDDADRAAVTAMIERVRGHWPREDIDVWYVTLDAMRSRGLPQTELRPGFRDDNWALHRAHIHAGRFVGVRGPDPRGLVPEPVWEEIDEALQDELESIGEHLDDAPAYAVLNLCRLLYSYEMRDPVTGKAQAAIWAHAVLPVEHHALIRSALASYADRSYRTDGDVGAFFQDMERRIAEARTAVGAPS
jgi:hypothetical protein